MTWPEILDTARGTAEEYCKDGSVAWFRGHRSADYRLRSALHRHVDDLVRGWKQPPEGSGLIQLLRDEYKTLYRRFKADAWPLLDARERSDWGVIFTMQHYGLPTRLLDWTENFACAVFFAQWRRRRDQEATLWILDPHALNGIAINNSGFLALDEDIGESTIPATDWHPKWVAPERNLQSVAVFPIFTNPRMTAQRSAFTMAGDEFVPLDAEYTNLTASGRLKRLDLSPSVFDAVNVFLRDAGVNPFTFFPDLPGLALRYKAETERRLSEAKLWYPHFIQ